MYNGEGIQRFDTTKNKLYFSFKTSKIGAIGFSPIIFKKPDFFVIDTIIDMYENNPWIYAENGSSEILCKRNYIQIGSQEELETNNNIGDYLLRVSYYYYHRGFYYIKIHLEPKANWFQNDIYIKLDSTGKILDYYVQYGII